MNVIVRIGLIILAIAGCMSHTAATEGQEPEPHPVLIAEVTTPECWDDNSTLIHVAVRNVGDAPGRYTVTTQRTTGTESESARLNPGKARLAGYVVATGETVALATVTDQDGNTLYLRANVTGLRRCER